MRFVHIAIFLIFFSLSASAQNATWKNGFGINQDFHDYNVQLLDNKVTSFDSSLSQSIRLSYQRYLGPTWAVNMGLSNGFLLNQTEENKLIRKSYMFGGDIDVLLTLNNGKLLPVQSRLAPYLSFGYNFNYVSAYKKLQISSLIISNEYGFGLNVRLGKDSRIQTGIALNQQLNGEFDTHMQYRLGFAQTISRKESPAIKPNEEPVFDYDHDGIVDAQDSCPTVAGIDSFYGCPTAPKPMDTRVADSLKQLVIALTETIDAISKDVVRLEKEKASLQDSIANMLVPEPVIVYQPKEEEPEKPKEVVVATKDPEPIKKEEPKAPVVEEVVEKPAPKDTVVVAKVEDPKPVTPVTKPIKEEPVKPVVTSPEPKSSGKSYYVIALSVKNIDVANQALSSISLDYEGVKLLPQPNGFYRVGLSAGNNKSKALELLEYAKSHGMPSAWLSYE